MDYLYINAIVNETYLDLPCGCEFSESLRRRLSGYVPNDEFLNTRDVENVFSYFSIKDGSRAPLLVLANVERQKNCASVGRATQCLGWEWDGKLIEKNMDAIFGARFYKENEIDRMVAAQERIPLPKTGAVPGLPEPIAMDYKTCRALLTAAFIRWLRHEDVLRIGVPAGVDYNSYVWQAVKQIYALFPVALRAEAGFVSYLPDLKKAGSRITFGFVPENLADSKTLFLDGSRRSALAAFENGTGRRMLDQLIEFICRVDESSRAGFLEEIYADVEGDGNGAKLAAVTARDYQPMGEAVALLVADEGPDKMMPRWKAFFAEQENYSPSMRSRISRKIGSQIEPESFCRTYQAECRDAKSLSEVLNNLRSYEAFCRVSQPLADAMWETTVEILRSKGLSFRKIYEHAQNARKELACVLSEDKLDKLCAQSLQEQWDTLKNQTVKTAADADKALKNTEDLYRTLLGSQRNPYVAAVLKEVSAFREQTLELKSQYAVIDLNGQFAKLRRTPAESMTEMKNLMAQARKLLEELRPLADIDTKLQLKSQIEEFLRELTDKTSASDARLGHILNIIEQERNYFAILEKLDEADKDNLDQALVEEMFQALARKCPENRNAYENLYEETYRTRLTLAAMAKQPDFVCKVIVKDLCRFNAVSIKCSASGSVADSLALIGNGEYAARFVSDSCTVDVLFGSKCYEGDWFRKLLKLEHNAATMGDKDVFLDVFYTLAEAGAFTGDDLSGCLQMISDCGLKFMEFFSLIIRGRIRNTTAQQYMAAYEQILSLNQGKEPASLIRSMNKKCEAAEKEKDKTAYKAFCKFAEKYQDGKKKLPKWVIPAAIGGGVALIALIVLLILAPWKKEEPAETTAPTETTAPMVEATEPEDNYVDPVYQVLHTDADAVELLYGEGSHTEFQDYLDTVTGYLTNADETLAAQIAQAYVGAQDKNIGLNDTTVSAREYFFWLCWLNAKNLDDQEASVFRTDVYEGEAASILRVLHHALPLTAEAKAEAPASEVEGNESTAAASDAATNADETTDPSETTEATTAPTEDTQPETTEAPQLPAIEQILEEITEAARTPFDQAKAENESLIWILKLFGKDLTKTFDAHLTAVNALFADDAKREALLSCYNSLPGDARIRFGTDIPEVTWDEYAFWKFWLMAAGECDSFSQSDSHAKVMEILSLLNRLPEESFNRGTHLEPMQKDSDSEADAADTAGTSEKETNLVGQVESMGIAARPAFEEALAACRTVLESLGAAG